MSKLIKNSKMKLVEILNVPLEVVENIPNINVKGNEEISVENHKGVEVFTERKIILKSKIGDICILGKDFEITYLSAETVIIKGAFTSLKLERSDEDE